MRWARVVRSRALVSLLIAAAPAQAVDRLADEFRRPPASSRPRVWWHWMNGNVSAAGAVADLCWMRAAGIGGAFQFDGGLATPTVVPKWAVWMSREWKAAFAASVAEARRLGLDLGIATAPGWSETGGPGVRPVDAMKKLVWSVTDVDAGDREPIRPAPPPAVAGPFQDVPIEAVSPGAHPGPALYRDARLLAFPLSDAAAPQPAFRASGRAVDAALLTDGRYAATITLPLVDGAAVVDIDLGRTTDVRSVRIGLPAATGFGAPKPTVATLEAETGSGFRTVATLAPTTSPSRTASFATVRARRFRLTLRPDATRGFADALTLSPGAIPPSFGPPPAPVVRLSELALSSDAAIDHAEEKAGFATVPDYAAVPTPPAAGIDPARVIDVTGRLRGDGTLDWRPPAPGRWRILRLGWSLTGHENGPAPAEATGLEVDKLDAARVAAYIRGHLARYRDAAGGPGLTGLLSDSIESGPQNWTETILDRFRETNGYDPGPWLPALAGTIVGDAARSDRFLFDWRRTIARLYADAHYATIARAAHAAGLTYTAEALEDHRPQLGDDIAMRAPADIPSGALWTLDPGGGPNPTYVADIKGAASVADLYAKPLVAAETFTAFGHPFAYAPADLRATADLAFALGVTRVMIHTSAHQPLADAPPGVALAPFLGQYFTRNETWAGMARGWTDYLARTSYLLSRGHHVADVALFLGEETPATARYGDGRVDGIPPGRDYDFVDAAALATQLVVRDGALAAPSGTRFRVLWLGGGGGLTLATLRRLRELIEAGAVVVGDRPAGSPSLADDDRAVAARIAALWGMPGATGPRRIGRGTLFPHAVDLARALGGDPDWAWTGTAGELAVTHRAGVPGHVWFVVNRAPHAMDGTLSLRATGLAPERWDAVTGRRAPLSYRIAGDATAVPLRLPVGGSALIVLRTPATAPARDVPVPVERIVRRLGARWTLRFDPRRGGPPGAVAGALRGWQTSVDPRVRYYSGVVRYAQAVRLAPGDLRAGRRLAIDLGSVADVAAVRVNGRAAGIAWTHPYRVDATGLLRPGVNRIEVDVANLWVNRLIGDAQPGAVAVAHVTGPTYRADAPLRPSGLLGPVEINATD